MRWQHGCDKKIITSYKILSITAVHCTEHHHRTKKRSIPNALSLINVNDIRHLKHLAWAIYDGALVMGRRPELTGNLPWWMVLASLHKHIYRGYKDMAHCPPFMLASCDCKEKIKALHHEGWLEAE